MSDGWTLLYDADCGFCRWCVAVLLVKDRHHRLRPVALQDPRAVALLPGMDEATRMASWHLVAPDGTAGRPDAALAPALRLLPGGGPPRRSRSASPARSIASTGSRCGIEAGWGG